MPGRDEPANYSKIFRGGATAMDMLDKDRADKATDQNDLRMFVWMSMITLVFAMPVWLGLCNHV